MRKWAFISLSFLLFTTPAISSDTIKIPCEILESSESLTSSSSKLNGIRYTLIRHANAMDRETLSKWLKAHSGTEVSFIVNKKKFKGILNRLAQCFGRGLLIHRADEKIKKRDIIDVILPLSP